MNRDRFAGMWKQFSGKVKISWGRLTNDPSCEIAGTRQYVAGKFQERYGISKEKSAHQLKEFIDRNRNWDPSDR
jgi:uncharacterized protein YjbJ (UPF0337 family)